MVGASDIIRICEDLENNIPDKSWMLYLLELFDSGATNNNPRPIELNLICQFNEHDNFWAIFAGVNRYKFTKVVPIVSHSYLREIILHEHDNSIEYHLTDLNGNIAIEQFVFQLNKAESKNISFQGSNQFTGIEWCNKDGNSPFPIRYEIEFSNLRYAQEPREASESNGGKNIEHATFRPYDAEKCSQASRVTAAWNNLVNLSEQYGFSDIPSLGELGIDPRTIVPPSP